MWSDYSTQTRPIGISKELSVCLPEPWSAFIAGIGDMSGDLYDKPMHNQAIKKVMWNIAVCLLPVSTEHH